MENPQHVFEPRLLLLIINCCCANRIERFEPSATYLLVRSMLNNSTNQFSMQATLRSQLDSNVCAIERYNGFDGWAAIILDTKIWELFASLCPHNCLRQRRSTEMEKGAVQQAPLVFWT